MAPTIHFATFATARKFKAFNPSNHPKLTPWGFPKLMNEHKWNKREHELIRAMRKLGYACNMAGNSFWISEIPIQPFVHCSGAIRHTFKSIQSAADYLCPIVRDESFTALVAA